MGSGALAAKVGSRLAHGVLPMVTAIAAAAIGAQIFGPVGLGGAGAVATGAGIGRASGNAPISLLDMIPIVRTGAITTGAADVLLGPGQMAVLAPSPPERCALHGFDAIPAGSPTVLVHGKQLVRVGDKTACGAIVCDGLESVIVGGPPATPPSVSLSDVAGTIGAVALGALLGQTGAAELVTRAGDALVDATEKVLDPGLDATDKAAGAAGSVLDKVGEMVGSVSAALEAILGGASLTGQAK